MTRRPRPAPAWVSPFLDALSRGQSVGRASDAVGIHETTAYSRRKRHPAFAQAWSDAVAYFESGAGDADTISRPHLWRKAFLEALAETSNVTAAAARAGVPTGLVYKTRRNHPDFRAQWFQALREGYEHLELETLCRLRSGIGKEDNKYDIANALRLLALHKETVARERALQDDEDEDAILASLDAKIDAMRAREAEAQRLLAREEADEPAALA